MPNIVPIKKLSIWTLSLSLACGGRPISWTDTGFSDSAAAVGVGDGATSGIVGVWSRTVTQDGFTNEVLLTFESDGVCEILLTIPDFGPYPLAGTWSTSDDEMTISDAECESEGYGAGVYNYGISGSTLTLSALSDSCPTRSALPGDWTRNSE